jgi:hypothetical protein
VGTWTFRPCRNAMDADWVRGSKLVRDESETRVPPPYQ